MPANAILTEPRIAFCTTCKDRTAHLEETLPKNIADNADYPNAVFVVLNYNSSDHFEEFIASQREHVESGRLVTYRFTEPVAFRMAHSKNVAHRLGIYEGADILVNLDADNFTNEGFARYLAENFESDREMFMWVNMDKIRSEAVGGRLKGLNGRIAVTKRIFLNSGGYDERFNMWGPDDKDFNQRLRRMGYRSKHIERRYLDVILHTDKLRFREYPEAKNTPYDQRFIDVTLTDNTIANFGSMGTGVVFRNDEIFPLELQPIPTRVFGVGLHKTGTTSLNAALKTLGLESAHWISAHWAKAIWEEMSDKGRSDTLERHYALSDLPIPLLFRELDAAYPNSRFVLTIRKEEEWIESVRNHWGENNQFRQAWDSDPFTHKVHKLLYGQRGFDSEVFLNRYRRHNAEVREYFKDRPKDLLVMDMSAGDGWYRLCGFLKMPIPRVPYPRKFVTPK